ncbi:MAG: glycosyltransferase [Planctomycetota bacterium]
MQIALFANTAWLDEELASLHHLVVGLMDEAVRTVQVLPEGRAEDETVGFGTRLSWRETRRRWANRRELRRLAEPLVKAEVALLHALDGRLWKPVLDLGQQLGVPVALSANSGLDVAAASRLRGQMDPGQTLLTAATAPLADLISEAVGGKLEVHTVPPGVHLGKPINHDDDETPCVVVSGDGGCDEHMLVLLEGMRLALRDDPHMQFFFDGQGRDLHKLWRAIERMGLLGSSTLIPRRLGHREVLLRVDALVHPQPLGRARSMTLRAMANAVPVFATRDPVLDYLQPGVTARVLDQPTPEAWAEALRSLSQDREAAAALGRSARDWVKRERLASSQLETLLSLYREIVGEPIAFPG